MKKFALSLLFGTAVALSANAARAADIIEPPMVIEQPDPVIIESSGGWYIRGDVDYHRATMRGSIYAVSGGTSAFDTTEIDDSRR